MKTRQSAGAAGADMIDGPGGAMPSTASHEPHKSRDGDTASEHHERFSFEASEADESAFGKTVGAENGEEDAEEYDEYDEYEEYDEFDDGYASDGTEGPDEAQENGAGWFPMRKSSLRRPNSSRPRLSHVPPPPRVPSAVLSKPDGDAVQEVQATPELDSAEGPKSPQLSETPPPRSAPSSTDSEDSDNTPFPELESPSEARSATPKPHTASLAGSSADDTSKLPELDLPSSPLSDFNFELDASETRVSNVPSSHSSPTSPTVSVFSAAKNTGSETPSEESSRADTQPSEDAEVGKSLDSESEPVEAQESPRATRHLSPPESTSLTDSSDATPLPTPPLSGPAPVMKAAAPEEQERALPSLPPIPTGRTSKPLKFVSTDEQRAQIPPVPPIPSNDSFKTVRHNQAQLLHSDIPPVPPLPTSSAAMTTTVKAPEPQTSPGTPEYAEPSKTFVAANRSKSLKIQPARYRGRKSTGSASASPASSLASPRLANDFPSDAGSIPSSPTERPGSARARAASDGAGLARPPMRGAASTPDLNSPKDAHRATASAADAKPSAEAPAPAAEPEEPASPTTGTVDAIRASVRSGLTNTSSVADASSTERSSSYTYRSSTSEVPAKTENWPIIEEERLIAEEMPFEDMTVEDMTGEETPFNEMNVEAAPFEETTEATPIAEEPVEEPHIELTSAEQKLAYEMLVEESHIEQEPVEEMLVGETPVERSVREPPVKRGPAKMNPIEETPVEEYRVEELPVERLSVERLPVERLPVERLPTERLPAERRPAERPPVERLPVEQLPVEETRDGEMTVEDAIMMYMDGFDSDDEPSNQIRRSQLPPRTASRRVPPLRKTEVAVLPPPKPEIRIPPTPPRAEIPIFSSPSDDEIETSAASEAPSTFLSPPTPSPSSLAPPKFTHRRTSTQLIAGELGLDESSPTSPRSPSNPMQDQADALRALTQPASSVNIPERDRYGFKTENQWITAEEYALWDRGYTFFLQNRKKKWVHFMNQYGLKSRHPTEFPPRSDKLKRYIRKGFPPEWRGAAWFYYGGGHEELANNPGLYARLVQRADAGEVKESDREHIERDLHRTFPDNIRFKDNPTSPASSSTTTSPVLPSSGENGENPPETPMIKSLRRVLRAFALHNARIGYCQSLNFLAGTLLLFLDGSEEKAFHLLNVLTHVHLPGTHGVALEGANVDIGILMSALKESLPAVWAKLDDRADSSRAVAASDMRVAAGLPTVSLATTAWFMSAFVSTLPIETAVRAWDVLFYEGSKTLFRIALAIFKLGEREIREKSDPIEVFQVVQTLPRRLLDANAVMDVAMRKGRQGVGSVSQEVVETRREERREMYKKEAEKVFRIPPPPPPPPPDADEYNERALESGANKLNRSESRGGKLRRMVSLKRSATSPAVSAAAASAAADKDKNKEPLQDKKLSRSSSRARVKRMVSKKVGLDTESKKPGAK